MTAIVCAVWMLVLCTGAVLPTFAIKYTYETKYLDVPVSNTVDLFACILLLGSKGWLILSMLVFFQVPSSVRHT
jgi:hypothetical protein